MSIICSMDVQGFIVSIPTQRHAKTTVFNYKSPHKIQFNKPNRQNPYPTFSLNPITPPSPIVVVGSANADIYLEIQRLPISGETLSATSSSTLAGGKGANQAACASRLQHPTHFVGCVGDDPHGKLVLDALKNCGVGIDHVHITSGESTGHAVVMLQKGGQNSIVIVGGANMRGWPNKLSESDFNVVTRAGVVLLQREIAESVNIQVAKAANNAGVPVILDAGGVDSLIPPELLNHVDILSPNESELARLTGMQTESFEQVRHAVEKCHKMGVKQVLVKRGSEGSALFIEGEEPIKQPIIPAVKVVDTTGAGDTFTAAFAVSYVEGLSKKDCLRFAAAAASLCVQVKGAIPSMPDRKSVVNLLNSV